MHSIEYQREASKLLSRIFGNDSVKTEWDASTHDPRTFWHKSAYAPRIDIAVGPFNSWTDIDIGYDKTAIMKSHPLVKKLKTRVDIDWNKFSRCFLAIEIEFSGSSKHLMGDIVNACMNGSVGILISSEKNYEKVKRTSAYFNTLDLDRINIKRNLVIFTERDFLRFLKG